MTKNITILDQKIATLNNILLIHFDDQSSTSIMNNLFYQLHCDQVSKNNFHQNYFENHFLRHLNFNLITV